MQQIFEINKTPKEYYDLGRNFDYPRLATCPNPACRIPVPPKKHGFYSRYVIDINFQAKIFIRRYYCPYCGMTFSYLPSFCIPYFQYTLKLIVLGLLCYYFKLATTLLAFLHSNNLSYKRQHLRFYAKRFIKNLNLIQLGIRQLIPYQVFHNQENEKGAQETLNIVVNGFPGIHAFSQRFYAQCSCSFMAPY